MKESLKISEGTMSLIKGIRDENPEFDSMDDAVRVAAQVYIMAKSAGVLVITGGFPLLKVPQE